MRLDARRRVLAYAVSMKISLLSAAACLMTAVSWAAVAQPLEYDRHGHALLLDRQGWLYVDRDRQPVLRPYIFDNGPDYYEEGLARFVDHGKMGFHSEALHIVVPAIYDFVFPFE